MRIEVYQDTPKEEKKVLRLRLVQDEYNPEVWVVAVDEYGEALRGSYIISISPSGIHRNNGVSPGFGLPLDVNGRVRDITP